MDQVPIPKAQPLPTTVFDPSGGKGFKGLADSMTQGAQMGYLASQTKALDVANQAAPAMMQLKQQELQMKMQEQQAAIQKQKVDMGLGLAKQAVDAYGIYGDEFGPESFKTFKKGVNAAFPGALDDEIQWTPSMGGVMKQAGDVIDALQEGKTTEKDAMYALMKLKGKAGKLQAERIQSMLDPVQDQFNQGQDNQRTAAGATAPLVGSAYSVNLAKTALGKGDELNDHIAIQEFGKLVNNGTPVPLPELQKMASSGTWGPKFAQTFSKFTGEGALSPEQRAMLNNALDTFGQSLQAQVATRTAQYPGATAPNLPRTKVHNGKTYVTHDGGKTWLQQ